MDTGYALSILVFIAFCIYAATALSRRQKMPPSIVASTKPTTEAPEAKSADSDEPVEGIAVNGNSGRRLNLEIDMDYLDSRGSVTSRRVLIKRFAWDGKIGGIWGFCQLRQRDRSFVIGRIQRAFDIVRSEPIADVGAWLSDKWSQSEEGKCRAASDQLWNELEVLFYFAKLDGVMRAPEAAVIRGYIQNQGFEPDIAAKVTESLREILAPTDRQVIVRLGRSKGALDSVRIDNLLAAIEAIVAMAKDPNDHLLKQAQKARRTLS